MTNQVATHADTGIVTEAELAKRPRDVRGRSAGWSPDADKGFDVDSPSPVDKFMIVELVEKFIRKRGSQYCVVSHTGKNLGCSPSKGGAAKRLAQVEYFKHKKSLTEDLVVKSLDKGEFEVLDDELAKFVAMQNYLYAKSVFAKHLPGKHNQQDHAGAGGAAGKVAHTPSQLHDAAARQYAKDNAVSISEAKKKVTSGAHVPTTKLVASQDLIKRRKDLKAEVEVYKERRHYDRSSAQERKDEDHLRSLEAELTGVEAKFFKSLIVKADQDCLQKIWSDAYKYYTGKWIAAAQQFVLHKDFGRAAQAMAKARDGYQEEKNPKEWQCLDDWRQAYQDKADNKETEGGE